VAVRVLAVVGVAVLLGAAAACAGGTRSAAGDQVVAEGGTLSVSTEGDGLVLEKADLDANGRPDVWTHVRDVVAKDGSKTRTLVKRTVDLNGDGKPDLTEHYDGDGVLAKTQADADFDGRVDIVRTFKKGKVESEEISSRFDGVFDVRKYYEDGQLVLKQVDTRHAGRFDEFQYFVGSKLYRVGWDRDGDGKPEVFEENPAME